MVRGLISISVFLFFVGCGVPTDRQESAINYIDAKLRVVSVYGERPLEPDGTVFFAGWEAGAPQTLFAVDENDRIYFLAYVIPSTVAQLVGAKNLEYFLDGVRVRVDERTTALAVVMMTPGYFWMFSPKALVFVADKVVEHPEFENLVELIRSETISKPGEVFEGKSPEIFLLAAKIAKDVRESLYIEYPVFESDEPNLSPSGCGNPDGVPKLEDRPGYKIAFEVRHMVFYGGGVFSANLVGQEVEEGQLDRAFVVKAQNAKIDLSLDNILKLNIINPKVETEVEVPGGTKVVRLEKGFELSFSIFTDSIKRIGFFANFGRIVKYAVEVAVPNIAACIPDGDTWGYVASALTNLLTTGEKRDLMNIVKSSIDEVIRYVVQKFMDENSFFRKLLGKVGLSGCGKGVNFVIKQIAATIKNFPVVKLYDAFTKYIPFGWELLTKPPTGTYVVIDGAPGAAMLITNVYPKTVKAGQTLNIEITNGGDCTYCWIFLICDRGKTAFDIKETACRFTKSIPIPKHLWGQCILQLKYGGRVVQEVPITVENPAMDGQTGGGSGGGNYPDGATEGGKKGGGCLVVAGGWWIVVALVFLLRRYLPA